MYTQCPECDVAFRVTAEVLKMAAGKVRCGNCRAAFNALEHLSETKPVSKQPAAQSADPDTEEFASDETVIIEADIPPETISAEQSAALMKTLDELAGEDIRIEDTGVEWRVVDDVDLDTPAEAAPEPPPESEPPRGIDDMLFDDNTVLPDDFDAVVDAVSESKPVESPPPAEPEPPQTDLDLSEPDEWDDLLDDLDEAPVSDEPTVLAAHEEAEAFGADEDIAESEKPEEPEEDDEFDEDELERSIEEDLLAAAFESEASEKAWREAQAEGEPADESDEEYPDEIEIDLQFEDNLDADEDIEDIAMQFDDTIEEDIATLSMPVVEDPGAEEIAADEPEPEAGDEPETTDEHSESGESEPSDEEDSDSDSDSGEHVIPEMTEEEKTINMLIDQELLSVAVEDEDGFASTIVQVQPDDEVAAKARKKDADRVSDTAAETDEDAAGIPDRDPSAKVETIIMEGEFVRSDLDDSEFSLNRDEDDYARRREMDSHGPGRGMIAGIAILVFLLLVQVVHQSRDALATMPVFNATMGPAYRMLGMPLTPSWNIAGWRFEATKGDTDESGEVLTIYSRIGNNADESLPYPLVHVSLTDRFEDIIGSTVLEPGDYLPEDSDPRTMVPPGNTFNAVITIDSPSPEATGFKLNVCYRLAGGQLRCADHDFK